MAESKQTRLNKVLREFNISLDRAVEYLNDKGYEIEARPTTKISSEVYEVLSDKFETDKSKKVASEEVSEERKKEKEELRQAREQELEKKKVDEVRKEQQAADNKKKAAAAKAEEETKAKAEEDSKKAAKEEEETIRSKSKISGLKQVGKIELTDTKKGKPKSKKESDKPEKSTEPAKPTSEKPAKDAEQKPQVKKEEEEEKEVEDPLHKTQYTKLSGPNFTGEKIDLNQFKKTPTKKEKEKEKEKEAASKRRKRKRISKTNTSPGASKPNFKKGAKPAPRRNVKAAPKEDPTPEEVQKQVRETLEKLQGRSAGKKGAKYRRDKRDQHKQRSQDDLDQQEKESKVLKVTEFVSVNEISTMMDVPVTKIISACMSLGMMVTMNQRLDAETLSVVAEEFGYDVEFVSAEVEDHKEVVVENPDDLKPRAPIVTVMGHVDHGKTSLLDYIRKENVIAGESGGITQHIGAYSVKIETGETISFLDTPGHEAFTAMRARGAQVTDIAIIVIAADDDVMPQTKEAISHAQAAGVPIVFAINKVDLSTANVERIKQSLASMNLLVEDWGGKVQSQEISAKKGTGIPELLEKVLLEAELLDLKANPNRLAKGSVVEAFLDKGRGYVSTILVQAGTLKIGDYVLAGTTSGKIKAMQDERGNKVKEAGPSTPISILGLDGAPQAGDSFQVMEDEREAKEIASKRNQLQREQSVRTQKHITLDEIGRRIALGDFKELNIILKADVDGSVEALTDSLQKLSTEEIQVNIIHRGVGAITESDVLLASASEAVIIGFNVRPAGNARTLADNEEIDIRMYSIIYDAINDIKDAMEGMLSPELKEEITGTAEIRETFKISKIGTIAGCMVTSGKIYRSSGIRLIRDGIVIHTGTLTSLKRFKDDAKEVSKGYDCGIQLKNYNDIQEGDILESYREVEVKKKLK
ncbi:translation initiation factor IF-2 [Psychroflexus gondwanensis]|jgi:translation initiation factor IF-2|uniref:Translation initiation factor IF-2 n=1 Tax=Psychroflexus gondwanensis ACAM 44 TaxID=1189619 RepID=N1WNZ3_9FLAO|nr:translation initiation factor IF-2 [Psychroflexus gondwanensis]EMY81996.1 translation initiation factor IF-2 [Psychroflexus gondwanensis ACAM 44]TXE20485.1 translation initiation factor IF-2 [Psychroflexus gondwanensis]